jgi:membrane protein DedA with SNARE-associated domain
MNDLLAYLAQWAIDLIYTTGYVGVFVLITLINLHLLPVPTQLPLGLAGFLIGQGRFSFVLVMASSTAGAVVASLILYSVGRWIGEDNLRRVVKRFEGFKIVFGSDLIRAGEVFEKHGGKAILIGHLVPAVGAMISIPAGLRRMPIFGRFLIYTILGSTLWNGVFVVLGLVLGAQWESVKQYASVFEYVALALMLAGVFWLVWRHRKARK